MPACAATWPANGIRTSCAPSPATPSPCCDPDGPSGPVFTWRAADLPATLNPPIAGDHDDHSFPPIPDPARMAGLRSIPLAEPLAKPAAWRPARRAGRLASAAASRLGTCPGLLYRRAAWTVYTP